MRIFALLTSFFFFTPIVLLCSLLLFVSLNYHQKQIQYMQSIPKESLVSYAALPTTQDIIQGVVYAEDIRTGKVKNFFDAYGSPLTEYAQEIVDKADQYGLDYRLLPAIGMQESGDCKRVIKNSFNCWGWGITGEKVTRFASYDEAIDSISRQLSQWGLKTVDEIGQRYNPTDTNDWKDKVNGFINEL